MADKITIKISKERLQAYVLIPDDEKFYKLDEKDIVSFLKKQRITVGINEAAIKKIVEKKQFNESILVAQGNSPADGKDANVEYRFDPNKSLSRLMNAKGENINLGKIEYIQQVIANQELAAKHPATKGIEGKTVLGEKYLPKTG